MLSTSTVVGEKSCLSPKSKAPPGCSPLSTEMLIRPDVLLEASWLLTVSIDRLFVPPVPSMTIGRSASLMIVTEPKVACVTNNAGVSAAPFDLARGPAVARHQADLASKRTSGRDESRIGAT